MKKLLIAALALATTCGPALADAARDAEEAVQARRGYYRMIAINTGALGAMALGKAPYDADKAAVFATNLDLLAKVDTAHVFPEGTDNVAMKGETRALPKIWESFDDARAKDDAFEAAAAAMAVAAPKSLEALQGQIGALSNACKECHTVYRAKDF